MVPLRGIRARTETSRCALELAGGAGSDRRGRGGGCDLLFNPGIGSGQTFLQSYFRFPTQNLSQASVVRIPPANALRPGHVFFTEPHARNVADNIRELVDADHAILTQIQRLMVVGLHQLVDSFYAGV